jgi:cell division septation protein DedD
MSYDFSFNKKTISFLLGGMAFVGIMLFIAGLLVGASWKPEPTALAAVNSPQPVVATTTTSAPPAPAPEDVPKEPVLKAEAATPQVAAPAAEVNVQSVAAPASAKQSHSNAPAESRRNLALPSLREADDVRVIQRSDTTAAEENDSVSRDQLAFSVQVGVFVDENAANQLVRQLQSRGYRPIILTANDDESRRWYAVRIGAYVNRTEATQAAANIGMQEKIKAVVRPLGSL